MPCSALRPVPSLPAPFSFSSSPSSPLFTFLFIRLLLLLLLFRFATLPSSLAVFRGERERGRRGRIVLPVNLPSFAFHMLCPAATLPPSPCPSVSHRAAISACLIHNLRGRSEHSVCSMKHGERRAALRPLHSSAQSERPPPASPPCCPATLLPCPLVSGSRARVARLTFMKL